MADGFKFHVPLKKSSIGAPFTIGPPFGDLNFVLLNYENSSLCAETAQCFTAGVAKIRLSINGVPLEIRNDDLSNNVIREVKSKSGNYLFQGNHVHWEGPANARYPVMPIQIQFESKQEQSGKIIHLELGQPYTITHSANFTTGNSWKYSIPDGMTIIYKGSHNSCEPGLTGCGGRESVVLVAEKKGTFIYRASYGQSWEKDQPRNQEVITFVVD